VQHLASPAVARPFIEGTCNIWLRQLSPAPHIKRLCGNATSFDGIIEAQYPCLMKVSEILKLVEDDGWKLVAYRGSHRQFKHRTKPGRVTVHGKPSDDIAPGTLNSILKQAGLKS